MRVDAEGRAVDAAVRADLDVVLDDHDPGLRAPCSGAARAPRPRGRARTRTRPRRSTHAGLEDDAVADDAALAHDHVRGRAGSPRRRATSSPSCTPGKTIVPRADLRARSDARERHHLRARVDARARVDHRLRRDLGHRLARRVERGRDLREGEVGVLRPQHGAPGAGRPRPARRSTAPARDASNAFRYFCSRRTRCGRARRPRAARRRRCASAPSPCTSPPTRAASSASVKEATGRSSLLRGARRGLRSCFGGFFESLLRRPPGWRALYLRMSSFVRSSDAGA